LLSATDRYIARQIIVPLVSCLVVAAMLLVLDRMLRLFDFVAQEGGPVSVVWKMLASLLPEYLSLGIPIGLLMGILLAFRKLALSTELDVLQAVGQGYPRLLKVPFIYAIVLAIVNLAIVGFIQPRARYAYEGLRYELRSGQLGASIKVGEFTRLGKNLTLRIEKSAKEGRELTGMFVNVRRANGEDVAVTAERGTFLSTDDPDTIILRLENGTLVQDNPKFASPRVLSFTAHDLPIDLPKIGAFRAPGERDRELTLPQLVRTAKDDAANAMKRDKARANFHFRMVEVAIMLLLPLLGLALAVPPKRSTSALGVFLSIVMVVAYHKVNEYAEGVGGLGYINPVIALWLPFALFAALIVWMFYILAFVPGGQPIGGLERVFGKLAGAIRRWFGRWSGRTAANA
jgi:lipopolysaccharide export system permease protein